MRRVCATLALTAALCGCAPAERVVIVVAAPDGEPDAIDLSAATWSPVAVAQVTSRAPDRLVLSVRREATVLRVAHPIACAESIPVGGAAAGGVTLRPVIDLGGDQPQVGFDAPFEVAVRWGCDPPRAGRITWQQTDGPTVALSVSDDGFSVRGRTPALATLHPAPLPWGVAPIAPSTAGAITLSATWRGDGHPDVRREVRITAAARASGLSSVPIGHRLILGGSGFRVIGAPKGGLATVTERDRYATFEPDVAGKWTLGDGAGRELALRVGRYDETPLDCGRSECHAAAAEHASHSPMTRVLARGLDGEFGAAYRPRCAIACHAVGEPGISDGGFVAVARAIGVALPRTGAPGGWSELPRPLRRLGGVGCTSCHGPGAIPEVNGRYQILRVAVCAVCHDAPPRYGHVAAWRAQAMARSDASPTTRADPRCASCHTTSGFLAAIGVAPSVGDWRAPADEPPMGIGCAACHAPHGAHGADDLVRTVPVPALFDGVSVPAAARICLRCHAPLDGATADASAAALWLGRGGSDPATGQARTGTAVHATVPGGCLGCHAGGAASVPGARGQSHTFAVDRARCKTCHGPDAPLERAGSDGRRVAERAARLWSRLSVATSRRAVASGTPPHAAFRPVAAPTPLERATRDVQLVLEDRAAGFHNAAYARALLDEAEALLARGR